MTQEFLAAQAHVLSHIPYAMIGMIGFSLAVLAVETVMEFLQG